MQPGNDKVKPMGMLNFEELQKQERMPDEVFAKLTELYFKEYYTRSQESYKKILTELESINKKLEEIQSKLRGNQ